MSTSENEIEKINILNNLGDILVETNTDSADIYYNQGLQIANNLLLNELDKSKIYKIKLYKSEILSGLGYIYYLKYKYKKAISLLEESINVKESIYQTDDEKYLLKYLSLCYFNIGDYESAIEYLYGSLEKIKENPDKNVEKDQRLESEVYYSLAKNYHKLERYDKSIDFYSQSITICKTINYSKLLIVAYNGLAQTYIELNKYKQAEKILSKAKSISKKNNGEIDSETLAYIARVKLEYNQLDSTQYYLSKAENIALKNKDELSLIIIYKNYALFQIKNNNPYEAAFYAKKYLKLGEIKKDFSIITEANSLLYQIYEAKGEYLRAFEYLKQYNNYKDSLSISDAQNIVLKHELKLEQDQLLFQDSVRFQSYKKQKEAELDLQKFKTEKFQNEKKLLYASIFILLLILFLFFKSIIQKKKDNKVISDKALEIEKQKELLEKQNKKLKTEALLFNILRICSSDDLSIHKILNGVIEKLNNVDFLGTINKSAVLSYSNSKNQFILEIEKNFSEIEKKQIIDISERNYLPALSSNNKIQVGEINNYGRFYFIPLVKNNKLLGITYLMLEQNKEVTQHELNFLESIRMLYGDTLYRHKISDKLRIAHIENTIKKKEIQRAHLKANKALRQQEAINDLMNSIIRNENVGDKIFLYVSEILGNTYIRRLNITLFDDKNEMVKFYFLRENGVEKIDNKDFPLSNISQETLIKLRNNERVFVNSIKDRENKSESDLQMLRNNINAFASFPLFMEEKLIGSMNISFEDEIRLSEEQERFMQILIDGVTIAINQNLLFNELSEKNIKLSELHQEISSSINYARSLQKSILPSTDYVNQIFNNKFILLKQKDVVGGDFYWVREYENYKMIACVDCTGHSVPGAFMTMLSRVLFREAASIKKLRKPDEIITQMDHAVKRILRQTDFNAMQDGMDMSLAVINTDSKEISFSSAQRPIIIKFKDKESLEVIKGSRFPVGGYYEIEKKYDIHTFKLDDLDSFYLFSDGFTDQFGGERIKKYGFKRLINTLNLINNLPMNQQEDFLLNELNNWKGSLDQIDDICFIGVRL